MESFKHWMCENSGYFKGLSPSTIEKKKAQMAKQAAMDDDNPSAYKKMPGDTKGLKTIKVSKFTQKYKDLFGEEQQELTEKSTDRGPIDNESIEMALKKKSEATGISLGILRAVMRRGMGAWKSGHRPGATQEQWGYARVNSFATKSSGTWGKADADLAAEIRDKK
jgi:hypothetical protein